MKFHTLGMMSKGPAKARPAASGGTGPILLGSEEPPPQDNGGCC